MSKLFWSQTNQKVPEDMVSCFLHFQGAVYRNFGRFVLPKVWRGGMNQGPAAMSPVKFGAKEQCYIPKTTHTYFKSSESTWKDRAPQNLSTWDVICMCATISVQILTLDFKQMIILEGNSHNCRTERDLICSSGHEPWAPEESLGESIKEAHYALINLNEIMEIEFHLPSKS